LGSKLLTLGGLLAAFLLMPAAAVLAQGQTEAASEAPQILTSDLANNMTALSDKLTVNLVFVDNQEITKITINGDPQSFQPADTVSLTKELTLTRDKTEIVISATNKAGYTREKVFIVYREGANRFLADMQYFVALDVRYEVDTNPTNDLSTPVKLAGVDVKGVVPDSQQTDSRSVLRLSGGAISGPWTGFIGAAATRYSKSQNENINTSVYYVGGGYRPDQGLFLQYVFAKVGLGSFDYSIQHTLTPGYQSEGQDARGSWRDRYALDYTVKDFAKSEQTDGGQYALRWSYFSLDAEKQDSYTRVLEAGTATEGYVESEFNYIAADWDWRNLWDSGYRLDFGLGLQYRTFPNDQPLAAGTPLGDKRVDIPTRFSLGTGWQFAPTWSAMLNYQYLMNLSNKSPYVRQLYGLGVQGVF
jgi:hypothetical protein